MAPKTWTTNELHHDLGRFEQELVQAGLSQAAIKTYVDRAERFSRWLDGSYRPGQ